MRNCFVSYRGGSLSRPGTAFVGRTKQTTADLPPYLIPFQFSIGQGYALEFGTGYMRVVANGGYVLESSLSIVGASQANPCVVNVSNTYSVGDWVVIQGVNGMTQLNGNTYIVSAATAATITLEDLYGSPVNSTGYGAYTSGGTVARIFTLSTPYAAADLPLLKFAQSADVMSLTHPNYQPYELSRLAANNWTLAPTAFTPAISPPGSVTAQATNHPSTTTSPPTQPAAYGYVVTAVDTNTGQESVASAVANVTDSVDMAVTAGSIILTWSAVSQAAYYNIYRAPTSYNTLSGSTTNANPVPAGAIFGFIGSSYGTQFADANTIVDFAQVPPLHKNPFAIGSVLTVPLTAQGTGYTSATVSITSGTGSGFLGRVVINIGTGASGPVGCVIVLDGGQGYKNTDTVTISGDGTGATATLTVGPSSGTNPSVVAYFQERRAYASSLNQPDTLWFSQPGNFLNFDTRVPSQADDAITATPFSQQVNGVQFMVPMPGGLVVLTGLQAWQILGPGSFGATSVQAITPSNIAAIPQAYNGINPNIPPIVINYDILYVQSRGSVVRDLSYNFFANIYTGTDLTILSSHLFENYTIIDWAWCEEPWKLCWLVRSDGTLLSLTYLKEQEVWAWARHDSAGLFHSVCSVSEPPVNAAYFVTSRQGNGVSYYAVERLDNRLWTNVEDSWCVDCGLAYPMPAPTASLTISSSTGAVIFTAGASVFNSGMVGYVIRVGGGIAVISSYTSPTVVTGTWVRSPTASLGLWTLTAPVTKLTGFPHLIGQQVTGLADGVVVPLTTVAADGSVTLPFAATDIKLGLPFTAQIQSVYLDDPSGPTIQGRRKSVYAATVRVEQTAGLKVGSNQPDGSAQSPPATAPVWSPLYPITDLGSTYTSPAGQSVRNLFTGDLRVNIRAQWRKPAQVAIQQDKPLPMSVLAIVPEWLPGDTPEAFMQTERDKQRQ